MVVISLSAVYGSLQMKNCPVHHMKLKFKYSETLVQVLKTAGTNLGMVWSTVRFW